MAARATVSSLWANDIDLEEKIKAEDHQVGRSWKARQRLVCLHLFVAPDLKAGSCPLWRPFCLCFKTLGCDQWSARQLSRAAPDCLLLLLTCADHPC